MIEAVGEVEAPIKGDDFGVEICEGSDRFEGEVFIAKGRGSPDLDKLPGGDGNEGSVEE